MARALLPSTTAQELLDYMFYEGVSTDEIDSFEIVSDIATDDDDGETLVTVRRYEDDELKSSGDWTKIVTMFAEGYWRGETKLFSYTCSDGREVMKNGESHEPQDHAHLCDECGEEFVINEDGTANHVDDDSFDGIDHDADEDHVPYSSDLDDDEDME